MQERTSYSSLGTEMFAHVMVQDSIQYHKVNERFQVNF